MKLTFCITWLVFVRFLTAQNATYKISGAVVESGTNQPLPKVVVQIAPTEGRSAAQSVITGTNGSFGFTNLTPGKYSLSAGRSSSGMQLYQGEEGFSTAIVVGPDLDSEHVIFPLQKPASISGTIFDEEGAGLRGAQVQLYWQHVVSGRLELVNHGTQVTKSSGHFHFGHLQGGTYYLAVQATPWYAQNQSVLFNPANAAQNSDNSQQFDVAYPLTYYADTTDPSSATPLILVEGGTVNIEMALRPVPAIHVRLPDVEMKPNMGSQVTVSALGPGGQKIMVNPTFMGVNNHQELTGIAPGRYEISMQMFENNHSQLIGAKTVDLQNGSAIDLSSSSRLSVSGHITFEGKPRPPDPLMLYLISPGRSTFAQASIAADGTFQTGGEGLSPGRYHLELQNTEGFSVQSVTVKGGKWKDGQLELAEGANAQLSIVASTNSTNLDGIALRDKKPVPGAMVLLLPEEPDRSDLTRRDQSDSDGTFTLPNVLPGRYRILAIDNGHGLAYAEPVVIKPYLPLAQTLTVDAGKQSPLKVNVQTRLP
jgi:hypothetical protein